MATFLDLSLFSYFGSIFIFLFIFSIIWGLLSFLKIFKGVPGEKGIYGLIALSIALIVTMSKDTSYLIATMTPWFAVLMIFIFLIFLVLKMFSGENDTMMQEAIKSPGVYWTIIVLSIIILIASLSSTFGQRLLTDEESTPSVNIDERNELTDDEIQYVNSDVDRDTSVSKTTTPVDTGSTATDDFNENVSATLFHPKVLGLIMMMFIAFFTILFIAKTPDPN